MNAFDSPAARTPNGQAPARVPSSGALGAGGAHPIPGKDANQGASQGSPTQSHPEGGDGDKGPGDKGNGAPGNGAPGNGAPGNGAPGNGAKRAHLVVEHLVREFGDYVALSDVNLSISRGHIAVVIGGSGAGKTTLLKILIGLDRPTSGAVYLDGVDMTKLSDRKLNEARRKLGMVFQYSALLDSMNVLDNVAFPLREHTKLKDKEIRERVIEKLKALGLTDVEKLNPSELSGGMRKRVGLARALMLEPEVILYDEPTSGLDPITSRMVDDMILETRDKFGVTSVVISHDMAGALRIADEIYVLSKGKMAVSGSPEELVHSDHELVRSFFDSSGIAAERILGERQQNKPAEPASTSGRE